MDLCLPKTGGACHSQPLKTQVALVKLDESDSFDPDEAVAEAAEFEHRAVEDQCLRVPNDSSSNDDLLPQDENVQEDAEDEESDWGDDEHSEDKNDDQNVHGQNVDGKNDDQKVEEDSFPAAQPDPADNEHVSQGAVPEDDDGAEADQEDENEAGQSSMACPFLMA